MGGDRARLARDYRSKVAESDRTEGGARVQRSGQKSERHGGGHVESGINQVKSPQRATRRRARRARDQRSKTESLRNRDPVRAKAIRRVITGTLTEDSNGYKETEIGRYGDQWELLSRPRKR